MFDGSGRGSASLASSPGGPCAVTSDGGPGLRCSPLPQRPRPRSSRGRHPLSEAGAVAWSRRPGTRQPGCVCCANSRRPAPPRNRLAPHHVTPTEAGTGRCRYPEAEMDRSVHWDGRGNSAPIYRCYQCGPPNPRKPPENHCGKRMREAVGAS